MDNIIISFIGRMVVIPASASTLSFSSHDTRLMIHLSSFFRHSSTMVMYRAIRSSFVSYSHWICPTISWESLLISYLVAANIRVRSSLARTISYSASLLEVEKLRWIACSISSPIGDYKIRPTSDPGTSDAPSTWSVHHCSLGLLTRCVCFLRSSVINYPFKDNHDWYLIPCSFNSIAHFNIRPDRFSWCKVTRSG